MNDLSDAPTRPFLAMNEHYLLRYSQHKNWKMRCTEIAKDIFTGNKYISVPNMPDLIFEKAVKAQKFYKNAYIYDTNCKKFSIIGYELIQIYRDPWNLWGLVGTRRYYYRFTTGVSTQLTFEQARNEIVEHICSHRWVGQTGGTPAHFRKLQASKKNMAELIEGISFYGKWPF